MDPDALAIENVALKRQNERLVREVQVLNELAGSKSGVVSQQVCTEVSAHPSRRWFILFLVSD